MKNITTAWQSVDVRDGTQMRLFVARPDPSLAKAPGVIVLQEIFGVNAHIEEVAVRIASLGYVAVVPELFHRTAPGVVYGYQDIEKALPQMQALTNETLEADLHAAHEWLQADKQTQASPVGVVGFCLGGKGAFIANAVLPLGAAASFYGTGIPALLNNYTARQQAPLLLFWGGTDKHADATQRAAVAQALHAHGKMFTQVEFSDAGHGYFCDAREAYHAHAAAESWAMLAVFLKNHLTATA
jgi:carboxymethylenebutenolidase